MYIVKIVVRLLCFPKSVMKVYRPISEESCTFFRTADETLFKVNIAVPSSLQSELHLISDSEVQALIYFWPCIFKCLSEVMVNVSSFPVNVGFGDTYCVNSFLFER